MNEHRLRVRVKAVPGASRDSIAGLLGDRVKVRISAPPEGGKANRAILKLFAKSLGIKPAQVSIISGATNPEKIIEIIGVESDSLSDLLRCDIHAALCDIA